MKRVNITIDEETLMILKEMAMAEMGVENISAMVRVLVRRGQDKYLFSDELMKKLAA